MTHEFQARILTSNGILFSFLLPIITKHIYQFIIWKCLSNVSYK